MIPVRLELKNFMSYGENVSPIDFDGMHVACLSGENGHGKTALLDAITWALWGQARGSADQLVRIGSNDMSVTFDFELNGNLYRVIKSVNKKRNAGMWELQTSDGSDGFKPITGQGIRDTGKQIERLLRMDYRTFINSAYIQQGKADEFTRQTVGDRKKVLADILDLSRYDQLAKKAKDHRDEAEATMNTLQSEITRLDVELSAGQDVQASLESAREDLARVHRVMTSQESALKALERRKTELEAEQTHAVALHQEVASTRNEITALEERLQAARERVDTAKMVISRKSEILEGYKRLELIRTRNEELEQLNGQLAILQIERSGLERVVEAEKHNLDLVLKLAEKEIEEVQGRLAERNYLQSEIKSLKSQVSVMVPEDTELISRDACRVQCRMAQAEQMLFVLDQSEKLLPQMEARVQNLRSQADTCRVNGDAYQLAKIDNLIAELGYDPEEHARVREEESQLREWERIKIELDQVESRLPEDINTAGTLEELISSKHELIAKDDEALSWAAKKLASMPELESELNEASAELQSLRSEESSLTAQCAVYEHRLEELKEFRHQREVFASALATAESDLSAYSELARAFGRAGVQSLIIENAVPEIQEEANEILSRMTDGTMHVSLETLRETKTSGIAETLDIWVTDEVGDRDYGLLSGGEAFRVNFALRIALSKLLARRAGVRLETLVIDEGFGTQDGKGREKLVEAIDAVKGDFRRILVITHIEELKDAFPVRIEVVKDRDGSQVTVV